MKQAPNYRLKPATRQHFADNPHLIPNGRSSNEFTGGIHV